MPLLSICIPTYNRDAQLQQLLSDLQECAGILGDQIEILISDNCSTDATEQVVQLLPQDLPIRYFRQHVNIGATRNYSFLLKRSQGIYCWLLGDDDIINSEELIDFISHLKSHPAYALLIVDTTLRLECSTKLINMPCPGPCSSADILISIFKKSLYPFGHITSFVFNRKLVGSVLDGLDEKQITLGYWPHQFLFLSILWSSKLACYIYPRPLAMQVAPSSVQKLSILKWAEIEADRLNMICSNVLQIPILFKLIYVARELFSCRLLRLLILIAFIAPSSVYPFSSTKQKNSIISFPRKVISLFPRLVFSVSVILFTMPSKYSRVYIRLCRKYSVCPETSVPQNSPRYEIGP